MQNNLRRDISAILTAFKMDPERRELYVEGKADKTFLEGILAKKKNSVRTARILTIDFVNIPDRVEGGNRGRVIYFAKFIETENLNICFFIDADFDRIFNVPIPSKVLLTDFRDLEGYFLCEDCFEKLCQFGLQLENFDIKTFFKNFMNVARTLGILRIISQEENLKLPFQNTNLSRSIEYKKGDLFINLNIERYLKTLLQNLESPNLKLYQEILNKLESKKIKLESISDREIAHGKDTISLLSEFLKEYNVQKDTAENLLRMGFDLNLISNYPNLQKVIDFLSD